MNIILVVECSGNLIVHYVFPSLPAIVIYSSIAPITVSNAFVYPRSKLTLSYASATIKILWRQSRTFRLRRTSTVTGGA
jgi:hypothetical protein